MTTQTSTPVGVTKIESKSAITLDNIKPSPFKKNAWVAQLRQIFTIISKYPSMKVASDMQDTMFAPEEFGATSQDFESVEKRIAWILVPVGTKEETIVAKLVNLNAKGAVIYRVLSNKPYLDDNQKAGVAQELTTYDKIANKQAIRYPENDEKGRGGQLILDKNNNVQYRRTFYYNTPKADMDLRDGVEVYHTPEIEAELKGASAIAGQTINL